MLGCGLFFHDRFFLGFGRFFLGCGLFLRGRFFLGCGLFLRDRFFLGCGLFLHDRLYFGCGRHFLSRLFLGGSAFFLGHDIDQPTGAQRGGHRGVDALRNAFFSRGPFARVVLIDAAHGQADSALTPVDTEDAAANLLPDIELLGEGQTFVAIDFRDVAKPLDTGGEFDENTEIGDVGDRPADHITNTMRVGVLLPLVGKELFHGQGDALVVRVDRGNHGLDLVALLHDLRRMVDSPGPRHVGDVDESVDAGNDLDEGAEIGEIADHSLDPAAYAIRLGDLLPGVGFDGAQRQRESALFGVDLGDHDLHLLAHLEDRPRILDFLRPRHFAHMDQALDALFDDDECAVVHDADDLPFDPLPDRVFLGNQDPGILETLLIPEGDPFAFPVEAENHHVDLVADREVLAGVTHAPPRDVRDVEQTVQTAQIDKNTVVGEVLYGPRDELALLEGGHGLFFNVTLLLLQDSLS